MIKINRVAGQRMYTPICDFCGEKLGTEDTWYTAVGVIKKAGWASEKGTAGQWLHFCPRCARHLEMENKTE